jgi:hypothetical protein
MEVLLAVLVVNGQRFAGLLHEPRRARAAQRE